MDKIKEITTFEILQLVVSVLTALLASSGLWIYFEKKNKTKDCRDKLLMGLAHDRIMYLGMKYLLRGWITQDEYENLYDFLYMPYAEMGGNGTGQRIMEEVRKLPIRKGKFDTQGDV